MKGSLIRRIAAMAFVVVFVSLPAFPRGVFSVGVGANISYSADALVSIETDGSGEGSLSSQKKRFSFDNVSVGLEARVNVSHLQLTAVGELSSVDSNTILASGILAAGVSFDLFSVFRIGVAVGPKISYAYTASATTIDLEKTSNGKEFLDAVADGNFNLRFTLDIIAGPVLTIGAAYVVPTAFSISKGNYEALFPDGSAWSKGQVSLCIQMSLF